jgi:hypothetical protein
MIHYVIGNACEPCVPYDHNNQAAILHIVNNRGGWGRGFVLALSKKWPITAQAYRNADYSLGRSSAVLVEPGLWVVNMSAQNGYASAENPRPLRYDALATCLETVRDTFKQTDSTGTKTTLHCPRIGCGLAGGNWETVKVLLLEYLENFDVYVYDLPQLSREVL